MAAGEVIATVSALAGIGSKLAEAMRTVRETKALTPAAVRAISEAQELVLSLQSRLFELQEKALALQEENRQLRAKVSEDETWAAERQRYETKALGQGAAVVPKGESQPLYCPNCFSERRLAPLNRLPYRMPGPPTHACSRCRAPFNLR